MLVPGCGNIPGGGGGIPGPGGGGGKVDTGGGGGLVGGTGGGPEIKIKLAITSA